MKNLIYFVSLLFCIVVFATCSNEDSNSLKSDEASVMDRFTTCKDIAVYHSEGLNFAFNKLKEMKALNPSKNLFLNVSVKEKMAMVNSLTAEFVSQQQIASKLSAFDKKIDLLTADKLSSNEVAFRSSNDSGVNSDIKKLCDYFDSVINRISDDASQMNSIIENAIQSSEFAAFSTEEQNTLMFMLAIYEDSSTYWSENLNSWKELINSEKNGTSFRSSEDPYIDDDPAMIDNFSWHNLLNADAIGVLAGGVGGMVGGAVGGAIAGAAAGGVGAIPGAIAGAFAWGIAGAVTGAVSGSMAVALSHDVIPDDAPSVEIYTIFTGASISDLE